MSRVGLNPIPLPKGVEVKLKGGQIEVKGSKGSLNMPIHPDMMVNVGENTITVSRPTDHRMHRSLHGLTRSLINNMVVGVVEGYRRELDIVGVGYRAQQAGDKVIFQAGYSKPVEFVPPAGITVVVESPTRVVVQGIDKQQVGQVAALVLGGTASFHPDVDF